MFCSTSFLSPQEQRQATRENVERKQARTSDELEVGNVDTQKGHIVHRLLEGEGAVLDGQTNHFCKQHKRLEKGLQ